MTEKTICTICRTDKTKGWMGQGGYTLCRDCAKDTMDFELQPNMHHNIKMLAEVFFRRGKGEDISYKKLHEERSSLKFITFEELFKMEEKKQ